MRPDLEPCRRVGVAVPQANPTVEAELRVLMPADVLPVVTRLRSRSEDSEQRLEDYFRQLGRAIASFDTLKLDAFGFACTGSSYLAGERRESASVKRLTRRTGMPVTTACGAIRHELELRGARRIAILAPYPESLCRAALGYWRAAGYKISALERLRLGSEDTRRIYDIDGARVLRRLLSFDPGDAEVLLLSGTGMPTLGAIAGAQGSLPVPAVSSNLCLAYELARRAGRWPEDRPVPSLALRIG